jgi:hypothetical protein
VDRIRVKRPRRYFSNASLYNRDRPVFKKYVPILRAINRAGWQPVTYARVLDDMAVFVERWGDLSVSPPPFGLRKISASHAQVGNDQSQQHRQRQLQRSQLYWTIRQEDDESSIGGAQTDGAVPRSSTLQVEAEALHIRAGEHHCEVLSNGWRGGSAEKQKQTAVLRVGADGMGIVKIELQAGATLVLVCYIDDDRSAAP